jgi:catechol 2,3-dioxygenase-like lactoylglutathione lyase family enzyme
MKLGCFSVSLSVKDLSRSRIFYEALGFEAFSDTSEHGYLIMKNGDTNIGIFQGMFEGNMLTFNPGWDQNAQPLDEFADIRDIYAEAVSNGVEPMSSVETGPSGPGSFMVTDPDGNTILFDQHR